LEILITAIPFASFLPLSAFSFWSFFGRSSFDDAFLPAGALIDDQSTLNQACTANSVWHIK
jgi:hypothetical protein